MARWGGRKSIWSSVRRSRRLRAAGIVVAGPYPPDTMFTDAARPTYDAAICLYHDQALIPLKTLDMAGGVNVTLGLPIIRTSPDHGTAFGIAGQGVADPGSLIAAMHGWRRTWRNGGWRHDPARREHRPCGHGAERARRRAHPDPVDAAMAAIAAGSGRHHRPPAGGPAPHPGRRHRPAARRDHGAAEPGDGGNRRDGRQCPARPPQRLPVSCRSAGPR